MTSGVYFAQVGDMVKIGWSSHIPSRLTALRNASPVEVVLLLTIHSTERRLENALHKRFAHIRGRGEWFTLNQELLEFIKSGALQPIADPIPTPAVQSRILNAVARLGGPAATAAICLTCEQTIRQWMRKGCLNRATTVSALRFSKASGIPIRSLIAGTIEQLPRSSDETFSEQLKRIFLLG